MKKFPQTSLRLSYFLPSLLLVGISLGWVPGLWSRSWLACWAGGSLAYGALAFLEAIRVQASAPRELRGPRLAILVGSGIIATHLAYGWNFLVGLAASKLNDEKKGKFPVVFSKSN